MLDKWRGEAARCRHPARRWRAVKASGELEKQDLRVPLRNMSKLEIKPHLSTLYGCKDGEETSYE